MRLFEIEQLRRFVVHDSPVVDSCPESGLGVDPLWLRAIGPAQAASGY